MADQVTLYRNEAFEYVGQHQDAIIDTAQQLGVSATAIAGAIAEERDAYARNVAWNAWWDVWTKDKLVWHSLIVAAYNVAVGLGISDVKGDIGDEGDIGDVAILVTLW